MLSQRSVWRVWFWFAASLAAGWWAAQAAGATLAAALICFVMAVVRMTER